VGALLRLGAPPNLRDRFYPGLLFDEYVALSKVDGLVALSKVDEFVALST